MCLLISAYLSHRNKLPGLCLAQNPLFRVIIIKIALKRPFYNHCFSLAGFFADFHQFAVKRCINLDIQTCMVFFLRAAWYSLRSYKISVSL